MTPPGHNHQVSTVASIPPPAVRWDLSALYSSIQDPAVAHVWEGLSAEAEEFSQRYREKVGSLDAVEFAAALKELEKISEEAAKPINFAQLSFVTDTANPAMGAFLQRQMEMGTQLNVLLMFFELELQALPEEHVRTLLQAPELSNYRHYITVARAFSAHRLSEPEEIILEETANTGVRAWTRLFEELSAKQTYTYKSPHGEELEITQEEVLNLLREPDREVRQAAADAFTRGLQELRKTHLFIYNNLLQDKAVEDRLRKCPYPEYIRHLSNELQKTTVDMVMDMCRENYGMVERFYTVKREILDIPELTHIDRYAPLFPAEEVLDYDSARKIVLEAFGRFHPEMRDRAEEFFTKSWIDAEPRPGKQGGAFCAYLTPDTHPVVLVNYLNKLGDVSTLAHELGHGVHASLSREQSYFNFHGTLPLAELASTFGEMLVFESIVAQADLKDKVALYAEKIEGIFATIFRQACLYRFEQRAHTRRRTEGELTAEQFGDIWQEEVQAMFGSALTLGEQHRSWWMYISHFFEMPFYVYAYSFGELLVLSLYQKAKREGPQFAKRYISLLRKGGSESPSDLMGSVGIDLNSREFWQGGFDALNELMGEFEDLWGEYAG